MDIKYNKQKQELRGDPVLDFLFDAKDYLHKNQKKLLNLLVIIIVGFIAYIGINFYNKNNNAKIQNAFGTAMIEYETNQLANAAENLKNIADKHPGSAQGMQSAFLLAGLYLDSAKYDDAEKYYKISSKEKEFIGAQSYEGLGACYEAKGDVAAAIASYNKALANPNAAYRHGALRWKIALLHKDSDKNMVIDLCRKIIADTNAIEHRQKAENLLAVIEIGG